MTSRMLVGLIGTNIQKSLSPALHEDAFAAAGVAGHYHLMDVSTLQGRRLEDLLAAARTAGFAGVNITHPFKEAVIPLLDAVSTEATRDRRGQHRRVRQERPHHRPQHRLLGLPPGLHRDALARTPCAASRCCCWAPAAQGARSPSR